MNFNSLQALTPLDGRYHAVTTGVAQYLSEYALIWARVRVECSYIRELGNADILKISKKEEELLTGWSRGFSLSDAEEIKAFEKTTNHDVKAVEYWLREKAKGTSLEQKSQWFHFGLTSEDVNSIAYGILVRNLLIDVVYPSLFEICETIHTLANTHAQTPMLARTHGQPASPTTFGKEMRVFAERLSRQLKHLQPIEIPVKFGGATGTLAAHHVAFPEVDWDAFAEKFVERLNIPDSKTRLFRVFATTQIEPHDRYAELFDTLKRINTILIDFSQDFWRYISDGWLIQNLKKGEVGSSTMPHKVNPIDFENAEGNLGIANALFEHFSRKLPISRLQRDLSDSTVERAFGEAFGHAQIAYASLLKGLQKIEVNKDAMRESLNAHPEVLTEAIQTVLRREGIQDAYELLKNVSRGEDVTIQTLHTFIDTLPTTTEIKEELKKLTPSSYTGLAERIAKDETPY